MQLPGKLIDRSLGFALLTAALLNHQLNIFIVKNTDKVTFRISVVQGNIVYLEDVPKQFFFFWGGGQTLLPTYLKEKQKK